jgi:type I restriction enzyme S subunit
MKTGWKIKKFKEVCILQRGFDLPKKSRDKGKYPLVSSNGITDNISEYKVKSPGVVTGRSGTIGNVHFIENNFWPLNTSLYVKEFFGNYEKFIFYLLKQLNLEKYSSGAGVPTLNRNNIHEEKIYIPESIVEQRRIVAILDEAFAGIAAAKENAEQNLKNISEIFKSWFNAVSSPSEQESWTKKTVSELVAPQKGAMRTGPFGSQLLHTEFVDKGIAVLGIDNAVENEFSWGKKRFITEEKYQQMKRYKVNPNDVLITIMGTCGRCAVVPEDIQTAINTKHLCCITLNKKKCLPWYLHTYFLYHPLAQDFLSKHAKGAIMAGLNMGIIKELPVLLPHIEKQNEIVANFHFFKKESQRLESLYQQKLSNLEELKKSLLQQAFSGAL